MRYRARGSGPGCPATCGESPNIPDRHGTALSRSFTLSVRGQRIPRESWPRLAGVPVHVVAARLGHADPSITLRVYAHVISDQLTQAADIFARAVAATS